MPKQRIDPLFYYGAVESMARAGAGTAEIWGRLREIAAGAGLPSVGLSGAQVSRLRGQAGSSLRAERAFAAADPSERIRGEHVGLAAWARPWPQREAMPMYQVTFLHTTIGPDGEETHYRFVRFPGGIPITKEALLADLEADAQQMADKYGVEHVGIDQISIREI